MNKQKEIKEIAHCIYERIDDDDICTLDTKQCDCKCTSGSIAELLYDRGYRKQSENNVELPCNVGDTVYAVLKPIFEDEKAVIEEWQVKVIAFDGVKWYAENVDGEAFEVGGDFCKLTREEAESALLNQ